VGAENRASGTPSTIFLYSCGLCQLNTLFNSMSYSFSGLYNYFVRLFRKNISRGKLLKTLKKPRLAGLFFVAG
jgi:hypothetical protein